MSRIPQQFPKLERVFPAVSFFFRRWLIVGIACQIAVPAFAQTVAYTVPRGIYTVKVPGTADANQPVRTYLGIQLLPDVSYIGRIQTVTGNRFSLDYSPHTAFATPDRTNYLHVLEGDGRGFIGDITEFRTADIVCAEDLTQWIQPGTLVQIRPHSSLSDIFGTSNTFGLGAGLDADSADNVVIWDPVAQQERIYYYHSTRARWEEMDNVADAANAVFRYPYGFYIVRRSPGNLRIALSGIPGINSSLQLDPVLLPVRQGANVFSLPVNLSGSLDSIISTDGPFPVVSGPNANRSDILTLYEPTSGLQRGPFYHLIRPGTSEWREVGVNNSSAFANPLDFLSTLVLQREGDAGRLLVEGSLEIPAVPRPILPPDPEPGEIPLSINFPDVAPPGMTITIQVSQDLQTWSTYAIVVSDGNGRLTISLPAGQTRAFYRLCLSF